MKTRYLTPSLLMAGLIALASPAAMASDELAGALLGAGAGAVVGHAIGGHDGAIVGGFLGAVVGASAADDHRVVYYRPRPYRAYGPARYYAPPPWSGPHHAHHYWRYDRDGRHDGYRYREVRRDDRRDYRRDGWRDDHGPRSDGPWDYRNW